MIGEGISITVFFVPCSFCQIQTVDMYICIELYHFYDMPICPELISSFRLPSASGANLLSRCQFRALCASTWRTKGFDMNGWIWHYQIMFQNTIVMYKDLYVIVWDKLHFSRICILFDESYQIALILPLCIWDLDGLCYIDKSVTNDIIDVEAQCSVQSFFQHVMFLPTSFGRDLWILQKDSYVTLPRSCSPGTGLQVIYPLWNILLNQCTRFYS